MRWRCSERVICVATPHRIGPHVPLGTGPSIDSRKALHYDFLGIARSLFQNVCINSPPTSAGTIAGRAALAMMAVVASPASGATNQLLDQQFTQTYIRPVITSYCVACHSGDAAGRPVRSDSYIPWIPWSATIPAGRLRRRLDCATRCRRRRCPSRPRELASR